MSIPDSAKSPLLSRSAERMPARFSKGYLEIYEICQPLITIKKCLSASSQQIISAQAMQYCRQIDSY
ncbi:hypothetical protein KBY83_14030, partial [Cyanobium sp. WKJ7-Wakatipu]|uniref:hypothetical protein n=1 Tax=Cyanobium sp. WKJ7-Wakatipu TaxID=2823726 RepID=UPI0020CD2E8C